MSDKIIEIRHLIKKYRNKVVLNDLSLTIPYNQITTIYGPSGCGKSTLLNIIGVLDKFQSGTVQLFGKASPKVGSKAARLILRNQISYLFQNFALINDMSIDQNLNLVHFDKTESTIDFQARKLSLLKMMAVDLDPKIKINRLSGGEQQRVALIRALLKPSQLILCDEPTGSLDPENRDSLFAALQSAKRIQKSVVIVSHDPEIIRRSDYTFDLGSQLN